MHQADIAGIRRLRQGQKTLAIYGQFAVLLGRPVRVPEFPGDLGTKGIAVMPSRTGAVLYVNLGVVFHVSLLSQSVMMVMFSPTCLVPFTRSTGMSTAASQRSA